MRLHKSHIWLALGLLLAFWAVLVSWSALWVVAVTDKGVVRVHRLTGEVQTYTRDGGWRP